MSEPVPSTDKITPIKIRDIENLGIKDGELYWKNKKVITEQKVVLSFWQKIIGSAVAIAAFLAAITSAIDNANKIIGDWCLLGWGACVTSNPLNKPPENTGTKNTQSNKQ